ncbi:MAG: hypothetical protein WAJ88_20225 [Pseudolabrys sp.]
MDVVLDYISVSTFRTILLIFHSLLAVALLGALTHQAIAVAVPARQIAGRGWLRNPLPFCLWSGLRLGDLRAVGAASVSNARDFRRSLISARRRCPVSTFAF